MSSRIPSSIPLPPQNFPPPNLNKKLPAANPVTESSSYRHLPVWILRGATSLISLGIFCAFTRDTAPLAPLTPKELLFSASNVTPSSSASYQKIALETLPIQTRITPAFPLESPPQNRTTAIPHFTPASEVAKVNLTHRVSTALVPKSSEFSATKSPLQKAAEKKNHFKHLYQESLTHNRASSAELKKLDAKLKDVEARNDALEAQIKALMNSNLRLKEESSIAQKDLHDKNQKLEETNAELTHTNKKLLKQNGKLIQLNIDKENSQLAVKSNIEEHKITFLNEIAGNLKNENDYLKKENDEQREQMGKLAEAVDDIRYVMSPSYFTQAKELVGTVINAVRYPLAIAVVAYAKTHSESWLNKDISSTPQVVTRIISSAKNLFVPRA